LVKKFQSCCKASILHFKSSSKPNYFLTSTPSRHTPSPWPITCKGHTLVTTAECLKWTHTHHHDQSLVRDTPHFPQLTYFRHCWDGEILTSVLTWHPIKSPFFPLISVYIFQISPVFINKVLQSFNNTGDSILTSEKKTTKFQTSWEEREKETPKQPKKARDRYLVYFILSFAGWKKSTYDITKWCFWGPNFSSWRPKKRVANGRKGVFFGGEKTAHVMTLWEKMGPCGQMAIIRQQDRSKGTKHYFPL
jgi:hypothetical protein